MVAAPAWLKHWRRLHQLGGDEDGLSRIVRPNLPKGQLWKVPHRGQSVVLSSHGMTCHREIFRFPDLATLQLAHSDVRLGPKNPRVCN